MLSKNTLNASTSDINAQLRNIKFKQLPPLLPECPLCSRPSSTLASEGLLCCSNLLPIHCPPFVAGSPHCRHFSKDQSQRQKTLTYNVFSLSKVNFCPQYSESSSVASTSSLRMSRSLPPCEKASLLSGSQCTLSE